MRPLPTTAHLLSSATAAAAVIAAAAAAVWLPSVALAQDQKAAQVEERQEAMKTNRDGARTIGAYVKGEGGTVEDVRAAAEKVHGVSVGVLELFPEGTGVGVGDSDAKPEIWQNWAEFQQAAATYQEAANGMVQAAGTGDKAQIAAAFGALGKSCGGCHDHFRVPQD
jgi:cytochrome c556